MRNQSINRETPGAQPGSRADLREKPLMSLTFTLDIMGTLNIIKVLNVSTESSVLSV